MLTVFSVATGKDPSLVPLSGQPS